MLQSWTLIAKIAFRNISRNRRRTLLTMLSIAFGLAVMLWMDCIMAGRNIDMISTVTGTHVGHLQIYDKNYKKEELLYQTFELKNETLRKQLAKNQVFSKRVLFPSLISSGEQSSPILLFGVEPETESQITNVKKWITQGTYLKPEPDPDCPSRQIVMGKDLADSLQVEVGSKVVILGQAADGTLGNDLLRVQGIFDSESKGFNKRYTFSPLPCVQKLGVIKGIHELVIRVDDDEALLPTQAKLKNNLNPKLEITSWHEAMPPLATMVTYNKASHLMISVMLFMVIAIGILNTLLMSVFERTREFGVMTALGITPVQIRKIMITESLMIAIGASLFGIVLGVAAVFYHQKSGFDLAPFLGKSSQARDFRFALVVFPVFKLLPFFKATGAAITVVVLSGLYPAYRASAMKPVEAMRSV